MRLIQKLVIFCGLAMVFASCKDDRVNLAPPPIVKTNPTVVWAIPDALFFSSQATSAQIVLSPAEHREITWSITHKPGWLNISPPSGTVGNRLTISLVTGSLFVGKLTDKIVIATSSNTIEIPVTADITESIAVTMSPNAPFFNLGENSQLVTLINNTNEAVGWRLESLAGWLGVTPSSGTLAPNQTIVLTLTADRSQLESQNYNDHLTLYLRGVKSSEVAVGLTNLTILAGLVVDAEYDRTFDKTYVVTDQSKLLQLSQAGRLLGTLSLPSPPTCISVGKNGLKAVVGHDGYISLIDLATMTVEATYPVSCYALDVVLAPNSWAYVFPQRGLFTTIRCINLQTGAELPHTGQPIYESTKARLHPSGDYIYGANNGVSPSGAQKYDIRGGQAIYLYENTFQGEFKFEGELWFADDGARLFTRARSAFNLSTTWTADMLYAGNIPGLDFPPTSADRIKTIDHTSVTNRIGVVIANSTGSSLNLVRFFFGNLGFQSVKDLPPFIENVGGNNLFTQPEGHYGFFNSAGTKFIVVIKSRPTNGAAVRWAVTTIPVN